MFAALPRSSANSARWLLLVLALLMAATALVVVASPWADRQRVAGTDESWADSVLRWFARAAAAIALAACIARFWWRVHPGPTTLPGDQLLQVWSVVAEFAALIVLTVAVAVQAPWKAGRQVMGFGLAAPLVAGLACVIATVFGSSLTLAVANLIGSPKVTNGAGHVTGQTLLLPSTVYDGGLGMVAVLVVVLGIGGYLFAWSRWEAARLGRLDDERPADSVQSSYQPLPGDAGAVTSVARTWSRSELTDHAATALSVLTVPTAALLVGYLISLQAGAHSATLQKIAQIGGALGVAVTVYFLATLRSAFLNASARKRFGLLWDVGTFWPRACHPFGPPCYAERSVPEVVTRIRRMVGDDVRGPGDPALAQEDAEARGRVGFEAMERQGPLLLTGYSQGTPISVAVMAQLPQRVREQMSLLTLAAPIRRLYGRAFPAYFGPDQLACLTGYLSSGQLVRWRNLVRRSDYIGGWAFDPVRHPAENLLVDRVIADPPTLWGDKDPSPPPTHLHSDWFPDPQVRPYAAELARQLEGPGR